MVKISPHAFPISPVAAAMLCCHHVNVLSNHSTNSLCVLVKVKLNSSQEQMEVSHCNQHERHKKWRGSFLFFTIYLSLSSIFQNKRRAHKMSHVGVPITTHDYSLATSKEEPGEGHYRVKGVWFVCT